MPRNSSALTRPNTVYVVLQRETDYCLRPPNQHECSCVSVHTTLAAANQAAKDLYDVDDQDEEDFVEWEDGWQSWEDLDGLRVQTDSTTGALRVIEVDGRLAEKVAWVEKHTIEGTRIEEKTKEKGSKYAYEEYEDEVDERANKKRKQRRKCVSSKAQQR